MPLPTGGRQLLFACVLFLVLAGTASAGSVDHTVALDTVDSSGDGTVVSVSVGANESGVSASADAGTTDSDIDVTLTASADETGVSADADGSVDGTDGSVSVEASTNETSVSAEVEDDGEPTTVTATASSANGVESGDSHDGPQDNETAEGAIGAGEDATPAQGTGPPGDGSSGSDGGSGVPTEAAAGAGLLAVAGGTALARRGVSVVSTGATPLATVSDALTAAVYWLRAKLVALVPLRYSRRDDSDPLEHEVRADLHDAVETTPGVHLSRLEADVDVSMSSVRHHLRVLEDEDLIESERIRGKRRFFPAYATNTELRAALDEPATASVLRTLATMESPTVSDLADALGRDPSTITHHLSRLEADGLVEREREGQAVVTRLADTPQRVLAAEDAIEATSSAD